MRLARWPTVRFKTGPIRGKVLMLKFADPPMLEGTSKNWINFPRQTTPQATATIGAFYFFHHAQTTTDTIQDLAPSHAWSSSHGSLMRRLSDELLALLPRNVQAQCQRRHLIARERRRPAVDAKPHRCHSGTAGGRAAAELESMW